MSIDILTRCIHLEEEADNKFYGAVSFPIFQTATFAHPGVGESTGYDYSRLQNPTREHLEKVVAALEGGSNALAFTSGMAAISSLMELFKPGDNIIVDQDLYGGTVRLFDNISTKNNVEITRIDFTTEDVGAYIKDNTKAIYVETPTNPMMNVIDIEKLSEISKKKGLLLIVDNTFLSPYFQNPIALGADIVVHSGTKYLGGHNDTLSGFLVTSNSEIAERLRFIIKTTGAGLPPFDSWLILRGIKTLGLRMEKSQENAFEIVRWLQNQDEVTRIVYPGLESHPGYEIIKKQSRGFGAMITFEVASKEFAQTILKNVKLIRFAESLGGVETLITYPVTQTHADVPKELLEKNGINDRILRLSVGIEASIDLINEFERVFETARRDLYGREKS